MPPVGIYLLLGTLYRPFIVGTSGFGRLLQYVLDVSYFKINSSHLELKLCYSEFYPYPSAVRSIKEAADWVGMDRLMWGSDYPRTITAITYKMSYDFIVKSKELSEQDKAMFLGENALRFYGFKNLPELPYIKNMSE